MEISFKRRLSIVVLSTKFIREGYLFTKKKVLSCTNSAKIKSVFPSGKFSGKEKGNINSCLTVVQVILFEIDCAIFYTNIHELFSQFISWTNWVKSGKFMDNCWISCQVMADMEKFYDDLIIINLYLVLRCKCYWSSKVKI